MPRGVREHPKGTPFMDRIYFEPMSGCWLWGGSINGNGYGQLYDADARKMRLAHRVSYEISVGTIPNGMELDHKCRSRACVNPDHLEAVTHDVNMERSFVLITHCPSGHEYSPRNTRITPIGNRMCRECDRLRQDAVRRRRGDAMKTIKVNCPNGHEYALRNGKKVCRVCDAIRQYNKRHPDNPRSY